VSTAKRARESKLLLELQRDHGYTMSMLPERDRQGTMVTLPTSKTRRPGSFRLVQFVKLAVPDDSALGRALRKTPSPKRRKASRLP
jgi:hypothetical protein